MDDVILFLRSRHLAIDGPPVGGDQQLVGGWAELPGSIPNELTWVCPVIEAKGPQITATLNGQLVNTYASTRQTAGFLALQMHDWRSRLQFRSLAVKKLP